VKRGIVIESHVSRGEKGEGRMRKLTKSFQKRQSIASRVLCFLLVLAMVVTMVPALGRGSRKGAGAGDGRSRAGTRARLRTKHLSEASEPEVPRKTPRQARARPYRKPTQVGG